MQKIPSKNYGFFQPPLGLSELETFIKSLPDEAIDLLSTPYNEVAMLMHQYLSELLKDMPRKNLNVAIAMDRETLIHLLGTAMVYGYFLKTAQERMMFEQALELAAE
jgi:hypothetical protein